MEGLTRQLDDEACGQRAIRLELRLSEEKIGAGLSQREHHSNGAASKTLRLGLNRLPKLGFRGSGCRGAAS